MAISLFGFKIGREKDDKSLQGQSFITPTPDDGAATVTAAGYYGTYLDLDATAKSESELITRYREASFYPDCDSAIEDITTEAISAVDAEAPVELDLENLEVTENIKDIIKQEFEEILSLLDFGSKGHDIFRRWYIDGRLYYQKVVDLKNPRRGILDLRYIDPRKIRKVRDVKKKKLDTGVEVIESIEEFYIYNERGINYIAGAFTNQNISTSGIKIAPDTIAYCPSGVTDLDKNVVLSYLHKAIKPVNQLKMMEDALVIYRISRAPERRIFYIDVGNLPKIKAEQYIKDIMAKYRNKIVYDSSTGEIRDDRKFMSMLEDFWLPRREGGRGTEITTLPGGENLGQIEDIQYFQNKLYQSLNVPLSRLVPQQASMIFGRQAEITRDELKFGKFISRLRNKFTVLFDDLLRTQLILKGIITDADWNDIKEKIGYKFAQDQYFQEIKESEDLRNRVDVLTQLQPFIGTFFSQAYVKKHVLRMTEEDVERVEEEIAAENQLQMQQQIQQQQILQQQGIDPQTVINK